MIPIANASDLRELLTQPRAFVFLAVIWAVHSRRSEQVARRLIEDSNSDQIASPIPAYRIDLSDQKGELWDAVHKWLRDEKQAVDQFTLGGYGSLLLIRSGRIVASVVYVADHDYGDMLELARTAFENSSPQGTKS
jgi:hypothetical protein